MITPQNITRHELIGLDAEVKDSENKTQIGIRGKVINETMKLIEIETDLGEKKIPKKESTFIFNLPDGKRVEIEGNILVMRPEDRIKKKFKKW